MKPYEAVHKFDDDKLCKKLCRLHAFNAITTLSVDNRQTEAFTLQIENVKPQRSGKNIAADIERQSIEKLVNPYRSCCALTSEDIEKRLDECARNPLPSRAENMSSSINEKSSIQSPKEKESYCEINEAEIIRKMGKKIIASEKVLDKIPVDKNAIPSIVKTLQHIVNEEDMNEEV